MVDGIYRHCSYSRVCVGGLEGMEMNTQPEALRWVNLLEYEATARGSTDYKHKAAAELRRLHQSEHEGWRYANELEQERKRLHEANQAMMEALKEAKEVLQFANESPNGPINDTIWMMHRPETLFDFLDAAISKGEQA